MSLLPKVRTWYVNYGFLVVGILLLNIGLLNWYIWSKKSSQPIVDTRVEEETKPETDNCDLDCINQIVEARLKLLPTPVTQVIENTIEKQVVVTPTLTKTNKTVPTPTPTSRTEYVGLADGSSSVSSSWTSMVNGKWLDTSLYGTLVSASWEGWIDMGGSGTAYARLYDATNDRAVDGSEIMVTDTVRTSFYSGNISLWRGQNQYFIQVKSTGGGTVSVDGVRMKLVVR